MPDPLALPADLSDAERAVVTVLRTAAVKEADARAALAVLVRRAYGRARRRGCTHRDALSIVVDVDRLPVSTTTAERIVQRRGAWAV